MDKIKQKINKIKYYYNLYEYNRKFYYKNTKQCKI